RRAAAHAGYTRFRPRRGRGVVRCLVPGQHEAVVDDHAHMDESLRRRWAGEDVDLSQRLPSDLVLAAAEVDPSIMEAAFPYTSMRALPSSLDALEPRVHALYDEGWRPTPA